jgi:hypothetical protein
MSLPGTEADGAVARPRAAAGECCRKLKRRQDGSKRSGIHAIVLRGSIGALRERDARLGGTREDESSFPHGHRYLGATLGVSGLPDRAIHHDGDGPVVLHAAR